MDGVFMKLRFVQRGHPDVVFHSSGGTHFLPLIVWPQPGPGEKLCVFGKRKSGLLIPRLLSASIQRPPTTVEATICRGWSVDHPQVCAGIARQTLCFPAIGRSAAVGTSRALPSPDAIDVPNEMLYGPHQVVAMIDTPGVPFVLTAPLTESVDHAGFFIQMSLASIPEWMEWVIDKKYPSWRNVPTTYRWQRGHSAGRSARPRGGACPRVRSPTMSSCVIPNSCRSSSGDRTRVVAVSTHNPLGTTFAAGVYASIFGTSREPINALYARRMFDTIRQCRQRHPFSVVLGGSGAWQIEETGTQAALGIDTVVTGRAESGDVISLFARALAGELLPPRVDAHHPHDAGRAPRA